MLRLLTAVFFIFLGTAHAQVPYGIPVKNGFFIPVNGTNNTNNRNVAPYPNQPSNSYQSNSNPYPPASYGFVNPQPNYYPTAPKIPTQSYHPAQPSFNGQTIKTANQVVYGAREPGDVNVLKTVVVKPLGFMRNAVVKNIIFPDPQSKIKMRKITEVVVKNNKNSSKGWTTEFVSGGIGKPKIDIKLKTRDDMDLALEIYGFPM